MLLKLYEYFASHKSEFIGSPIFVSNERTVEDVMKADKLGNADIENAFPIKQEIEETQDIKCYDSQGGTMAKIIHKGPYEKCAQTYEKVYAWIQENKKTITGLIREVYLNDPNEVGIKEALTEIYVSIE